MKLSELRAYWIFLMRNKLYTLVSVFGFSVSLMFVITLGLYVKEQLSVDDFQVNKDRIFLMTHDSESGFGNTVGSQLKESFPEIESSIRIFGVSIDVGEKGTEKIKVKTLYADSTFFKIFSLKLTDGDPSNVLRSQNSVVVSQSFANKYFPDKNPIGLPLYVHNKEYVVAGLMEDMPRNTILPEAEIIVNYHGIVDLWGTEQIITTNNNFGFITFLVEKEGSDIRSKTPEMLQFCKNNFWLYQNGFTDDLKLIPLKDAYFKINDDPYGSLRGNSITMITLYSSIAILIFVIALLNYINLTVAQASFRGKEAAIKKLIGCSRGKLIKQLLVESLIMSTLTFGIGLILAFLAEPFFNEVLVTTLNLSEILTPWVIVSFVGFVVFVALISGIIPALFISSFNPIEVVKGTFNRKIKAGYSKALIIFQYSISILLLICSFSVKKQVDYMVNYNLGFNREGIFELSNVVSLKELDGLKSKLYSIPGVELISFSCGTPLNGGNNSSFELEGTPLSVQEFYVDSAFFQIYGISILKETGVPATNDTYWVNQSAYTALNTDTVTQLADMGWNNKKQISGILSDFNLRTLRRETGLVRIRLRVEAEQPWDIIVKISAGANYYDVAKQIEKEYSQYTGGELVEGRFVDDQIQDNYQKEKNTSGIMFAFTILTIIIMIMGVFAMSLYMIRQKQKEIGIRKVNGSTEYQILAMLNWDSVKRLLIACFIAYPLAYYALNKWLEQFPYRISTDWGSYIMATLIVLLLTLLSVSGITWRAARANPVDSLKSE